MAATEQLFNVRERKRFERHDIWERIAENGTISAAVMVFAAIAAGDADRAAALTTEHTIHAKESMIGRLKNHG